jgi:hypothetical protein
VLAEGGGEWAGARTLEAADAAYGK